MHVVYMHFVLHFVYLHVAKLSMNVVHARCYAMHFVHMQMEHLVCRWSTWYACARPCHLHMVRRMSYMHSQDVANCHSLSCTLDVTCQMSHQFLHAKCHTPELAELHKWAHLHMVRDPLLHVLHALARSCANSMLCPTRSM